MAQSVKRLTSAQVMISWFVSSSPVSGFVVTARSLEPASDSVCVCVCVCVLHFQEDCNEVYINDALQFFFSGKLRLCFGNITG